MLKYAIVENISTGKIIKFETFESFNTWARQIESRQRLLWDIIGGEVTNGFVDVPLIEHMKFWEKNSENVF